MRHAPRLCTRQNTKHSTVVNLLISFLAWHTEFLVGVIWYLVWRKAWIIYHQYCKCMFLFRSLAFCSHVVYIYFEECIFVCICECLCVCLSVNKYSVIYLVCSPLCACVCACVCVTLYMYGTSNASLRVSTYSHNRVYNCIMQELLLSSVTNKFSVYVSCNWHSSLQF